MNLEKSRPLVSVITVTWNCGDTIQKTLQSIRSIKNKNVEYIVIDGISTDSTLDIIKKNSDIVDVLVSEADSGIYNAMNKGVKKSNGKYILFLNGDDQLISDGFKEALHILEIDTPEILSCGSEIYSVKKEKLNILMPSPRKLYFYNSIPHMSTFVLSNIQKKHPFREDLKIASDYDFFLKLYLGGYLFMLSNTITAKHYQGGASSNVELSLSEINQIKKDNLNIVFYFVVLIIETMKNKLRLILNKF